MPSLSQRLSRQLILGFVVVAPFVTWAMWSYLGPVALIVLFTSHFILLYATLTPNCQWLGRVVTHFHTLEKEVWVTIDDGPDDLQTGKLLDLLDSFPAKVTFFVIGANVRRLPEISVEILRRGHQLSNHTYTHPSGTFWALPTWSIANQIERCSKELLSLGGHGSEFFRAPAGLKNPFVHPVLSRLRLTLIGWTVRGFDSVSDDSDKVAARILTKVRPGAIMLLHDGLQRKHDPEFSLSCIEKTLSGLKEMGYRCVIPTADQLRPIPFGKRTSGY